MWQPSRAQWAIIWPVALLIVFAWPPDTGRSLGMTLAAWAADPSGSLPLPPAALPMRLDDDGNAVAEHDMLENAYAQARQRSTLTRIRMDVKNAADPLERSTERQVLVGLGVVAALVVWQMDGRRTPRAPHRV